MDEILSIVAVCAVAAALLLGASLHRRYLQARLKQIRSSGAPHYRMRSH